MASRKIQETDAGGRKIELVGRAEGEPEIYIDGIHGMQLSGPVVKLNLYTLGIDTSPDYQRRESVARVVMSAPQFVQMVDFLTQLVAQVREQAKQAAAAPTNPAAKAKN